MFIVLLLILVCYHAIQSHGSMSAIFIKSIRK